MSEADDHGEDLSEDPPSPTLGDEAPLEPVPYEFQPSDIPIAQGVLASAYETAIDGHALAAAVRAAAESAGIGDRPLASELFNAASYRLQLERRGKPGCNFAESRTWPPAIASVRDPVITLWKELAAVAVHPAAIARLEDLLFTRREGNGRDRALRAAHAYIDTADQIPVGLETVDFLLRAWTLARSVRDVATDARAREQMFDVAEALVADHPDTRPGIVLPLVAGLARGPLDESTADPHDVDVLLQDAAACYTKSRFATEIADHRRSRAKDPAEAEGISRTEIEMYFGEADAAEHAAVRLHHLEAAGQVARKRGLSDLVRRASSELQRINPGELGLIHITERSELPAHVPETYLHGFTRSPDWRDGLLQFLLGDAPSGPISRLKAHAEESRERILNRWFPASLLGADGLPRATAHTDDQQDVHEMCTMARATAENIGRIEAEGLRRIAERYGVPEVEDLTSFFVDLGCRDPGLARGLAKAFRHYWLGDFESSVHMSAPKVEAAARNLLRELDEGIYRVQAGNDPGGYPGLYVLLDELEDIALDESWAFFLRWLLTGPRGHNLRNDVAHGFVYDISPAYAALSLRAAGVLVTVAGPRAKPVDEEDDARKPDDVRSLLRDPAPGSGGPVDNTWGIAGRLLERAWWTVQNQRVRHRRRQTQG